MSATSLQSVLLPYYSVKRRDLPWRRPDLDPYRIFVSEIMLQQTQANRVIPKFQTFMQRFPTVESLAYSELSEVLRLWLGLGYNRRAKFLWQSAREIQQQFDGQIPRTIEQLQALPGVGYNTAAAVLAYAYNEPVVFVETNIRTVFLHHFFTGLARVDDKDISSVVSRELDRGLPRDWYWAIMDYGTDLKAQGSSHIRRSKHYSKQATFEGSLRQVRGKILHSVRQKPVRQETLRQTLGDERVALALQQLEDEELVSTKQGWVRLGTE